MSDQGMKELQWQAFLTEIKGQPYDEAIRKVFADWLEDHDEPEEADFYRSWTLGSLLAAEEYVKAFAKRLNPNSTYGKYLESGEEPDPDDLKPLYSYEEFLTLAGEGSVYLNFDIPDFCHDENQKLCNALSVILNRRDLQVREDNHPDISFRCSC